jgi:predicted NBD/HSP70 family sugar kinase/biotin operon repressor
MGALAQLREGNRLRIVDELRRRETATRAELADATGLSRTTVTTLVAELQERGIVIEDGIADGARSLRGRPAMLLRLEPAGGAALGLDFGHSHIRVAVADLASTVLAERCVPFAVGASAPAALDAAAALAHEALAEAAVSPGRVVGAGMGLPGPLDQRTAIVSPSSILAGWGGRAAAHELATRLGAPVAVDNDANLGALAELFLGAGRGVADLIYLKVSSGIGAGLVLDGRLHHGATGIAGEIGHVQLRRDGAVCRCGNRGCLETVAASSAVLELLRPLLGPDLTLPQALALAREGHVAVGRVLADAGRAVGRAVADLCNMLNPQAIVVGGDLSRTGGALLAGVREAVDRYALPRGGARRADRAGRAGRARRGARRPRAGDRRARKPVSAKVFHKSS